MTNPDARAAAEQALREAGFKPPNAHGSHYAWTRYNPLTGVYDQVWLDDANELTLVCVRVPKSALSAILSQQQGEQAPQPPTQQTDPTDDHLQDALGQIADELYLAGLNESRLAPTLQCIEPILRKCLQQQHQRYMAALAELEALPPARSRDYETGYESALGDVRVKVKALTPPGGTNSGL